MSDRARRPSDVAVRKASRERLLKDMARAARLMEQIKGECGDWASFKADVLMFAGWQTSRTRYACLMTAFGL